MSERDYATGRLDERVHRYFKLHLTGPRASGRERIIPSAVQRRYFENVVTARRKEETHNVHTFARGCEYTWECGPKPTIVYAVAWGSVIASSNAAGQRSEALT
ncbi:hypothetical protein EVAR_36836_1 [Eumeta japonica]|uniref:Uncharacterized protein n=1 Tax=Eumeta variegata TaxID=151549 RepID=A0A4C1WD55_EUMVA|nr:hypothetical protein EVAR_36836_1 [Eumeta japonica]